MARSCGLRLGPRRYELVVLDGSAKKHQILAYRSGEFEFSGDDALAEMSAVLKEEAKTHNIPRENVGVAMDTGRAAFRRVTLPFSDRSKIDQVLKYEVESQLPQWNIDDVICDFHVLAEDDNSSELLISAVPKADVAETIDVCEDAGIEALEIELETSAMVNAATAAEICHIDDAQLLVHVGDYSTSVVVIDSGEVREMRVIHIGALTHDPLPKAGAEATDDEEGADEPAEEDPVEKAHRIEQATKRIRRELGRTISAARTINSIDAIYVCGMELPGLIGSTVLDLPVYVLDCFDEDGGQPADGFGALVVAYGVALRQLGGGVMHPSLRREELRYTGAFERIEFPLAVACLLLCTFLGIVNILQDREYDLLERHGVRYWVQNSNAFMIGDPKLNVQGALSPVPEPLRQYAKQFENGGQDPERTPLESLHYIKQDLQLRVLALQKELGGDQTGVPKPQSAFVASNLVLDVLESQQDAWRPSLRKVHSVYQPGKSGRPDTVKVTLDVSFFAESSLKATQNYEAFVDALNQQPWFDRIDERSQEPLEGDVGVYFAGLPITVDVSKYFKSQDAGRQQVGGN